MGPVPFNPKFDSSPVDPQGQQLTSLKQANLYANETHNELEQSDNSNSHWTWLARGDYLKLLLLQHQFILS